MEFRYSEPVDPRKAEKSGCFTKLQIRARKDKQAGKRGAERLREDWKLAIDRRPMDSRRGTHGTPTLCLPEGRLDRLDVVAYFIEWAVHYDDAVDIDASKREEIPLAICRMLDILIRNPASVDITEGQETGIERQMAKVLLHLDRNGAIAIMKHWKDWIATANDDMDFSTMKDYLHGKQLEGGMRFFLELCLFGAGISIAEEEAESISYILDPLIISMALTNDYYSWEVEWKEYQKRGSQARMCNSVMVLKKEFHIPADTAKQLLKQIIIGYEEQYLAQFEMWRKNNPYNLRIQRCLQVCGFAAAGLAYWHSGAQRFR